MLRFLQMCLVVLTAGPAECIHDAPPEERWRTHPLNRSLASFAPQWDDMNRRCLGGHPMLDSRFVDGLLHHFGDGSERLCKLERGDEPLGMCILKPAKTGVWTSFLPPQAQLSPILLTQVAGLDKLLPALPGLTLQADLLCLDPDYSHPFDTWPPPHRRMQHVLTMNARLEGGFDAYWARRTKNLRDAIRTRDNRLSRANLQPHLVRLESPGSMRAAVERFGQLETAGWKGRAGTAVAGDNVQGRFYSDILERFAATGQAVIYEYWLGDRLGASQLAITSERMMVLLKTSYDEDLATFSPGRLLLREVIRDAFLRLPGGVIEFYTHANADQLAWGTDQRWIEHISLYPNRAVEQLITFIHAARNRLQPAHIPDRLSANGRSASQPG